MNVEIRKEQHRAHNERLDILHNQAIVLHHVKQTKVHPPAQKPAPSYKEWNNNSEIDWIEIEKQLQGASAKGPSQPAPVDDEGNDESSEDSFNYDDDE